MNDKMKQLLEDAKVLIKDINFLIESRIVESGDKNEI